MALIVLTYCSYNEEAYLDEWITHHMGIGAEIIIGVWYGGAITTRPVPKNDDAFNRMRAKFPLVEFVHFHQPPKQYTPTKIIPMVICKHPGSNWFMFVDIDEFLFPTGKRTVQDILHEYDEADVSRVYINWRCYGSNGVEENPTRGVLDVFKEPCGPQVNWCNLSGKMLWKTTLKNKREVNLPKRHMVFPQASVVTPNLTNVRDRNAQFPNRLDELRITKSRKLGVESPRGHPTLVLPEDNPILTLRHYVTRSRSEWAQKCLMCKARKDRYNQRRFQAYEREI